MAVSAQSLIKQAQIALNDISGVRWPARDLILYLNMGQEDIRNARPDVTAVNQEVALIAGYKQSIPDGAVSLIDILANAGPNKERITLVTGVLLDAQEPDWRSAVGATKIKHFMHDARVPRVFFVYPPSAAGVLVEMEASMKPVDVPAPTAPGASFESVTGNIGLPDFCESALLSIILHYAYFKDTEFGGNLNLSQFHLTKASSILGVEIKTKVEIKREA